MKVIKFEIMSVSEIETDNGVLKNKSFYPCELRSNDRDFEAKYAFAKARSHDGKVTVEEAADEETVPSPEEDTAAMLVDHEYRLTLLELGLTEA